MSSISPVRLAQLHALRCKVRQEINWQELNPNGIRTGERFICRNLLGRYVNHFHPAYAPHANKNFKNVWMNYSPPEEDLLPEENVALAKRKLAETDYTNLPHDLHQIVKLNRERRFELRGKGIFRFPVGEKRKKK
ncbi:hypothetical protein O9G_000729 [Rozella allomycis CSF55]|uniref:Uncharacterized protein n=1 Tax=Rozella allomycis (strain CSF55) TaxID=988480 RepID=A0A075B3E0_ROZAC|nr:hypothetical protein O9G_000729 [Rozella allomycis CSF55]|eukprot:EPZ35333.1 hypothetical protein O9G_000729 [Rozella allomycis CSF55]